VTFSVGMAATSSSGSGVGTGSGVPGSAKLMKCDACGSTDIDVDVSRADAVCTGCGNVLESSFIVSDIQFEENAHGGSSAIGTFVSSDSKGGGFSGSALTGGGGGGGGLRVGGLQVGLGRESRELTLRNARKKIEALAHQLCLRRDRIDKAFHFFKLALSANLTRGRKSTHVIAACVYITCRTENPPTSHMLIDFSDVLQIDVYELGRTYLRLSQALHITIPALDPCLYVMRFAHKLEFGEKTHEVSMTALRLVSRMKKDWMHYGRRPSGLCGAALLIASRLHAFHRSVHDVIKVVKVHESTLRKRLNEFGETPVSQLSLDEFANVDLDAMTEEQDPPSFKAARKRDRDRLLQLEMEGMDLDSEIGDLESKIVEELEKMREKVMGKKYSKSYARESVNSESHPQQQPSQPSSPQSSSSPAGSRRNSQEAREAENFITEQTMASISDIVGGGNEENGDKDKVLMPPPKSTTNSTTPATQFPVGLGLKDTLQEYLTSKHDALVGMACLGADTVRKPDFVAPEDPDDGELDLTGIDDDEIDGYLMTKDEVNYKTKMWEMINADYIKAKAEKEEREKQEAEEAAKEGREIKKRTRKTAATAKEKKKGGGPGNATAIEAIEKIVQEKKISTKINYDVLKNLTLPGSSSGGPKPERDRGYKDSQEAADNLVSPPLDGASSSSAGAAPGSPRKSIFSPASPRKSFSSFSDRDLSSATTSSGGRKRLASFRSPPGSPSKKVTLASPAATTSAPKTTAGSRDTREVVVESGPVVREDPAEDTEEGNGDDYEDEDELDDDDETEDVGRMLGVGIDEEDAYIEEEYY